MKTKCYATINDGESIKTVRYRVIRPDETRITTQDVVDSFRDGLKNLANDAMKPAILVGHAALVWYGEVPLAVASVLMKEFKRSTDLMEGLYL